MPNKLIFDFNSIINDFKNGLSRAEIRKKYNIKPCTLNRVLRPYSSFKSQNKLQHILTKEFLEEHYIKQGKSMRFIAEELNIRSKNSVKLAIINHGLPLRSSPARFKRLREYKRGAASLWKGYGEVSGTVICGIRNSAKQRNLEFDIDAKFLWELYLEQDGKCALSGTEIVFRFKEGHTQRTCQTASLDRIDSSKGYTKDNVQWVHKSIQRMKWDMSDDIFVKWCTMIAKNKKVKK